MLAILIAISVVGTGSMGFLNFHMESRPEELWIDRNSPAYIAKTAAMTFPVGSRIKLSIVVTAPEIFQSDVFALVSTVRRKSLIVIFSIFTVSPYLTYTCLYRW